jgi:ABC-type nitrate/sulfonate/bicarbonate transport system permease component
LAVLAEMVGNPAGLGYAVVAQQQALRPDLMFACVAVIGLLGLALNALLAGVIAVSFPAAAASLNGAQS